MKYRRRSQWLRRLLDGELLANSARLSNPVIALLAKFSHLDKAIMQYRVDRLVLETINDARTAARTDHRR